MAPQSDDNPAASKPLKFPGYPALAPGKKTPKKLSTAHEDEDEDVIDPQDKKQLKNRRGRSANVDNFSAKSAPADVDNPASTIRLLRSLGARNPIAYLSRFGVAAVVYWIDQLIGEMAGGAYVEKPPAYLWWLLENDRERKIEEKME